MSVAVGTTLVTVMVATALAALWTGEWRLLIVSGICYMVVR